MSKTAVMWLSLVLAVAVVGYAGAAFAADQPHATKDAKATIVGKLDTAGTSIVITSAKGADGKEMASLAGKTLKLSGLKADETTKYAGKEVTVRGDMKGDSEFVASSIMPKLAAAHPAAAHPTK